MGVGVGLKSENQRQIRPFMTPHFTALFNGLATLHFHMNVSSALYVTF